MLVTNLCLFACAACDREGVAAAIPYTKPMMHCARTHMTGRTHIGRVGPFVQCSSISGGSWRVRHIPLPSQQQLVWTCSNSRPTQITHHERLLTAAGRQHRSRSWHSNTSGAHSPMRVERLIVDHFENRIRFNSLRCLQTQAHSCR